MNYLHKDTWIIQVKKLEEYHLRRYLEDDDWSFRKTAEELNRSLGSISQDLKLSLALRIYPLVSEFHSKDQAIGWLRFKGKCSLYSYREWSKEQIQEVINCLEDELKDGS